MHRVHTINGEVSNKDMVLNVARNLLTIAEVVISEIEDFDQLDETDLQWFAERVSEENYVIEQLHEDWKAQ